jgi:hypothetical protein
MYVVKIFRRNLFLHVSFVKKQWSEEMFSYEIIFKQSKTFFFKWSAKKWIKDVLLKDLLLNKNMEITDG